jgi:hypothetical protein
MTELPFGGDIYIEKEILKLKEKYEIDTLIETGSYHGDTTLWFAKNFNKTITIEINEEKFNLTNKRLKDNKLKAIAYLGSSEKILNEILPTKGIGHDTIFYLDAHWYEYNPLIDELKTIAKYNLRPIIVIHDMKEPTNTLQYDSYNNQDYCYEWVKPQLDLIYAKHGYNYYYNHPERSIGDRVGVLYVVPNIPKF